MAQSQMPPDILELLDEMEFPASKAEIIACAGDREGGEEAMDMLQAMPDRVYRDIHDLNRGLGKIEDLPGTDNGWWPARESASLPDETQQKVIRLKGKGQL